MLNLKIFEIICFVIEFRYDNYAAAGLTNAPNSLRIFR
jgi:hypothetical protein